MTNATLEQRGAVLEEERTDGSSGWMRRTVLVTFCLALLGTLAVVFTRVIAARVPEQRATLEKLINDRTGLVVRFDNVHFAWSLDGTSAVFERVELTDPVRGRVRVIAPELRVEFDAWDYLRHHQFSLGHVTLSSPDIEIIGDPVDMTAAAEGRAPRAGIAKAATDEDEATLVRRFTAWAELMPNGKVEVEGARVHLRRRGERAARHTFTLSQAVLSRQAGSFNAFGTMLLSQDVGQSLFLSAKLEGLGSGASVSGDLRVIARRVFLDKLPRVAARGRGTLDASVQLLDGRIETASWQASARELEFGDESRTRFDHFIVNGKLERSGGDFVLQFADLQLTRGARLDRAPKVSVRLQIEPGTTRVARTTLTATRVPFMAAEFIATLLAPHVDSMYGERMAIADSWTATAGELHSVRFDSRPENSSGAGWTFSAQVTGAELTRHSDQVRIGELAARVQLDANSMTLRFDPASTASLYLAGVTVARPLGLEGELTVANTSGPPAFSFDAFELRSGENSLAAQGDWSDGAARAKPLTLTLANFDRAMLLDGWTLLARDSALPSPLAELEQGKVVTGTLKLLPSGGAARAVNWQRSTGALELADLATSGKDLPRFAAGRGTLEFSRGNSVLRLDGGDLDQLAVTSARLDWPERGAPRLHATLQGDLASPLLRRALEAQGLERLAGAVSIEADARGETELRQPDLWRVTAALADASIPLAGDLPPVEKISGTVRYANGQLRGLALAGSWLGGHVEIESRRASSRGTLNIGITGVADSAPLLRLLGQPDVANRVNGQLSWTASAQHHVGGGDDAWQLSLASNLAGIESHLPEPFDKARARLLPVSAQLRVDANGIHDFAVDGRGLAIHGSVENGLTKARFEIQGVAGELRHSSDASADSQLEFERLDLKRTPALLAAAGAMLPADSKLAMSIGDLRYADRSLGALHASIARHDAGVAFSFESAESAQHQLAAQGACESANGRCRIEFTADTQHLAALLRETELPAEWPTETLHAAGELTWPLDAQGDLMRVLAGHFDLETQGRDSNHQMMANATLADGQIELSNVQGTGPAADQLFRGTGRLGLLAREYDLTIDYEQVSLAASAVPTPARARLARAWTALRGSAARRGWTTETPEARRVQWHGTWTD